jgi:glycosyltransferase involved in cell wall biosynthesis
VAELVEGSFSSVAAAADTLSAYDVTVIQHEYGIYGGRDGSDVLELLSSLDTPSIAVLHTVLRHPSQSQREILEKLAATVEFVVVQSESARRGLLAAYDIDPHAIRLIPHGAQPNLSVLTEPGGENRRPLILTWGLLSAGKGIEIAVEALAGLSDLDPAPRYLVLGETHPKVLAAEGEAYREQLRQRAHELGVTHMLEFEDGYQPAGLIRRRIREADIVLLPYKSRDQVVSGILTEAIASGKPVVATEFPHAQDLLAGGSGLLVPHDDPSAIALAIRSLVTDPALARRVSDTARLQAPSLHWSTVAGSYLRLADKAGARRADLRLAG